MAPITMRDLLEVGAHFGHQTRRWNPKMAPFIYAQRNGIHILDLAKSAKHLQIALDAVRDASANGETILFVGTKKQAQGPIQEEATRAGQPYVIKRWLGGMLTNFTTIRKRLTLMEQLEAREQAGEFDLMSKKEASKLGDKLEKLRGALGGMRRLRKAPGMVFIIDPSRETLAAIEANKLGIPVVGTADTNVDPDLLNYPIPVNDDAIKCIRLICAAVADAVIEGAAIRAARLPELEAQEAAAAAAESAAGAPEASAVQDDLVAALSATGTLSFSPDEEPTFTNDTTPAE
ncbi:MAG: 30S ribosomal protein S2 [Candidatus Limnocylindrus sp.]|jgi:small subunit ribosomal protein S2|nr:30S ribosomal protein S2 [Candidatus Aquidulcis sp.]